MRRIGIIAIISILFSISTVNAQVLVLGNFDFINNHLPMPFVDGTVGVDYIFTNPIPGFDYEYVVPLGSLFNIDGLGVPNMDPNQGVRIQLADGVSIRVLGNLNCVGDPATNSRNMIEAVPGGRWNQIIIQGQNGPIQATFVMTDISGGGGNQFDGLIRLRGEIPGVNLIDCYLYVSEHNGVVIEAFSVAPRLTLDETRIGWQPFMVTILEDGIRFEGQTTLLSTINLTDSFVGWCGGYGLQCFSVTEPLSINAEHSWFNCNGRDGLLVEGTDAIDAVGITLDNSYANANGNREPVGGFGVHVVNVIDRDGGSTIGILDGSDVSSNYSGGVRMERCEMQVSILNSTFTYNGADVPPGQLGDLLSPRAGSGIYIDQYFCAAYERIENNTISFNGHEGVFIHRGNGAGMATIIRGNRLEDNASAITTFDPQNPQNLAPLREGAGIYMLGEVGATQISNNLIIGGVSGVVWDGAGDYVDQLQDIRLTSNIQKSAHVGFVMIDVNEAGTPCEVLNNSFAYNDYAGAWVLSTLGAGQISSNIYYMNAGIQNAGWGILCTAPGNPNYDFACYWGNTTPYNDAGMGSTPRMNLDPLFINPQLDDVSGFHLAWNSPCVNRGMIGNNGNDAQGKVVADFALTRTLEVAEGDNWLPADVVANMDGTRNDIGPFGGLDCVWPVVNNVPVRPLTWDPYLRIDANHALLSDDRLIPDDQGNANDWVGYAGDAGHTLLEDDYYRGESNYQVDANHTLTIEEGTYFVNRSNVYFTINGTIIAGNFEDESDWIYMTGWQNTETPEYWKGMVFSAVANIASTMEKVYIRHSADKGVNVYNLVSDDEDGFLRFHNCSISDCKNYGLYIYNSHVMYYGQGMAEDPDVPDRDMEKPIGNHFADIENRIRSIKNTTQGRGIYIYGVPVPEGIPSKRSQILGTNIYDCGTTSGYSSNSGVSLSYADPILRDITVCSNGNTGLYLSHSTIYHGIDLNLWYQDQEPESRHNDIYRNGRGFQPQSAYNGAEICLTGGSYPEILSNDIQDFAWNGDTPGEQLNAGCLIYKSPTTNSFQIPLAVPNFWGFGEPREDFRDDIDARIYDDEESVGNGLVNFEWDWLETDEDPGWAGSELDDASPYASGMSEFRAGRYAEALALFEQSVEMERESPEGIKALRMIPVCYDFLNESVATTAECLTTIWSDCRGTEMGYEARLLIPVSYQQSEMSEEAIAAYDSIMQSPDNELQAVEAELLKLRLLEAEALSDGGETDAAKDPTQRIALLESRYEMLEGRTGAGTSTPVEYLIATAYPNPFNCSTTIRCQLPTAGDVDFRLHDITGRQVYSQHDQAVSAGEHLIRWNPTELPAGLYLGEVVSNGEMRQIKLLLLK